VTVAFLFNLDSFVLQVGALRERILELERAVVAKDDQLSSETAKLRRDLDTAVVSGSSARTVRELAEKHVYLSKNRDEFEADEVTLVNSRALEHELQNAPPDVLQGLARIIGDYCNMVPVQSLDVLAYVAALFAGVVRLTSSAAVNVACSALLRDRVMPGVVKCLENDFQKQIVANVERRRELVSRRKGASEPFVPMTAKAVNQLWYSLLDTTSKYKLPEAYVGALSVSIMSCWNRCVFHSLFHYPELSTFETAMQMKIELSSIQDYIYRNPVLKTSLAASKVHLSMFTYIADAASLLTIGKEALSMDAKGLENAFKTLNPRQVYKIIVQNNSADGLNIPQQSIDSFAKRLAVESYPLEVDLDECLKNLKDFRLV
jgi:hypothetical protein